MADHREALAYLPDAVEVVRFASDEGDGDFRVYERLERWAHESGIAMGPPQRDQPMGILAVSPGTVMISKWRGLTPKHRRQLDGIAVWVEGDPRRGTVVVFGLPKLRCVVRKRA